MHSLDSGGSSVSGRRVPAGRRNEETSMTRPHGLPPRQGLYDPAFEHDAPWLYARDGNPLQNGIPASRWTGYQSFPADLCRWRVRN